VCVFVGTTGTGSVNGKNDEQIEGLELRYETRNQQTTALELRFNPPIYDAGNGPMWNLRTPLGFREAK
jgi:hypothetical protein